MNMAEVYKLILEFKNQTVHLIQKQLLWISKKKKKTNRGILCYGLAEIKSQICRINEHFKITRKLECYGPYNSESYFVGNGHADYSWNWENRNFSKNNGDYAPDMNTKKVIIHVKVLKLPQLLL